MIRPAGFVMGVVMVGVAAGVYFGLDMVPEGLIPGAGKQASAPPPALTAAPTQTVNAVASAPTEAPASTEGAEASAPADAPAEAAPAPAPEPIVASAPPPEPEPAAAEPEPEPAPAPKPAPAPAPAKKAPAPAPAATESEAPAPAPGPKAPQADVIKQWWPDPSTMPENQLKLVYAGQVQGEQAIALLFSAALNAESVKPNIQVRTKDGQPVEGAWELGKNPRMVVLRGLEPGRYTVILAPSIADTNGYMLGTVLRGPVYVKAP